MKNFILAGTLVITTTLYGQNISEDSLDNKPGYRLAYLGERLCRVKTREEAYYYTYFSKDRNESFEGLFCSTSCKSHTNGAKFESSEAPPVKGHPVLLNGHFKTYDQNGNAYMVENFEAGLPTIIEDIGYDKEGKMKHHMIYNFAKKYKDQPGSFYFEYYDSNNILKESYYYGKNEKGKFGVIK